MAEDNIIHSIMGKGIDSTPDSLLPKNPGNSIFMRLGITGSTLFNALPYPAILLDAEEMFSDLILLLEQISSGQQ